MNWWALLLVAIGSLHLVACVRNVDWYFYRGRRGIFAYFHGRELIRGVYAFLGAAIVIIGLLTFLGIW